MTAVTQDTASRELVFTRLLDAPRELVFTVWTELKHLRQWWGPNGFTTTTHEIAVKPGGEWLFVMHAADGRDFDNKITFREVVRPSRLVYAHGEEDAPGYFQTTVTFEAEGRKTRLTMRMVFRSAEERDAVVREFGAVEGANQTLGRLAQHLAKAVDGVIADAPEATLVLTRIVDAPRELVFQAWTDAAQLAQWWGPKVFTNPVCEVDARPGGLLRIHMRAPDGQIHPMRGVYREVVRPSRLVFTNMAVDENDNPLAEGITTVTFAEESGKTKLTVHTHMRGVAPIAPQMFAGMEMGWTMSLEKLDAFIAAIRGPAASRVARAPSGEAAAAGRGEHKGTAS